MISFSSATAVLRGVGSAILKVAPELCFLLSVVLSLQNDAKTLTDHLNVLC